MLMRHCVLREISTGGEDSAAWRGVAWAALSRLPDGREAGHGAPRRDAAAAERQRRPLTRVVAVDVKSPIHKPVVSVTKKKEKRGNNDTCFQ